MNNLRALKKQFPIFALRGQPFSYLDNAATTHKPQAVLDALFDFYARSNSNIHRGAYALGEIATEQYERARGRVAHFLHAASEREIVFTKNATEAINLVAYAWGERHIGAGDEIAVSVAEHHSNFVPWLELVKRKRARFVVVPLKGERVDASLFAQAISKRTKVVAVHHVSNVLGSAAPVAAIAKAAHAVGARVMVDAAQSVAHLPLDVQKLSCDWLACSGHKMYGPTGIGVLYGREEVCAEMPPLLFGGGMIEEVSSGGVRYAPPPRRFEGGTPPIAEAIGLAAAVEFLERLGWAAVREHEETLCAYALARLEEIPGMRIYGVKGAKSRTGIISFNLGSIHSHDVATLLDEKGVCVRAGFHCAQPLMKALGASATCRMSVAVYNTREDIDALADGLRYVISVMK